MNTPKENLNDRLSAYLDGELSAGESAALERTLAVDPALRLELEELAEVKRMVGHLPRHAAPASMKLAIREQLERRSLLHLAEPGGRTGRPSFRFLRFLSAAAAVILATAVSITVWQQLHPVREGPANPTMRELAEGNHLGERSVAIPSEPMSPAPDAAAGTAIAAADPDRAKPGDGLTTDDLAKSADRVTHKGGFEDAAGGIPGGGSALPAPIAAPSSKIAPGLAGGRSEVRSAANEAEKGESLSLDERFDKGPVTAGDVAKLHFNNEAVQIDVPVNDAQQQEKVIADARKTIVANGGVDIKELAATTRLTDKDHQFVYEGQANRNFAANGNQSQIVLRGNSEVIGKVVDQLQKDANGQAQLNVQASRLRDTKRDAVEQVRRQSHVNQNVDSSTNGTLYAGAGSVSAMATNRPSRSPSNSTSAAGAGSGLADVKAPGKMAAPEASNKQEGNVATTPPPAATMAIAPRQMPIAPAVEPPAMPASQPGPERLRRTDPENPRDAKVLADGVVAAKGQPDGPGQADALIPPTSRPDNAPIVVTAGPRGETGQSQPHAATVANAPAFEGQQASQGAKDVASDKKPAPGRGDDMLDVVINVYVPAGGSQGQVQQLNLRPAQQAAPNSPVPPLAGAATQAEAPASAPAGH